MLISSGVNLKIGDNLTLRIGFKDKPKQANQERFERILRQSYNHRAKLVKTNKNCELKQSELNKGRKGRCFDLLFSSSCYTSTAFNSSLSSRSVRRSSTTKAEKLF